MWSNMEQKPKGKIKKSKKTKELIKYRIRAKRHAKERARRKKFLKLKHTGRLGKYYAQKLKIPIRKVEPVIGIRLPWWKRLILTIKRLLRKEP